MTKREQVAAAQRADRSLTRAEKRGVRLAKRPLAILASSITENSISRSAFQRAFAQIARDMGKEAIAAANRATTMVRSVAGSYGGSAAKAAKQINRPNEVAQLEIFNRVLGLVSELGSAYEDQLAEEFGLRVEFAAPKRMRKFIRARGFDATDPYQVRTIYRTVLRQEHARAMITAAKTGPMASSIFAFSFITMRDDLVRDSHAELDGTNIMADLVTEEAIGPLIPPLGWNCRCVLIPVYEPVPITRIIKAPPPFNPYA